MNKEIEKLLEEIRELEYDLSLYSTDRMTIPIKEKIERKIRLVEALSRPKNNDDQD